MVGRDMAHRYPERVPAPGEVLMEVEGWNVWHPEAEGRQMIRDAAFTVRRGEIVGIAGLMGAGRTELAMSLFGRSYGRGHQRRGADAGPGGRCLDRGAGDRAGLSYVTEDRKALGLVLEEPILRNISLANLAGVAHARRLDKRREAKVAEGYRAPWRSARRGCTRRW
jgi:putative multiple sugar transport system ATP-binding protein